jgi:hypothetical protein
MSGIGWIFNGDKCGFTGDATILVPLVKLLTLLVVQAFLKKWWVESDFKAPNLPLSLRLEGSGCHYTILYRKQTIELILKHVCCN